MNLKTEINITEHLNKLKSVLVEGNPFTFSETIDPSQATNNYNSLESIIDGSRNIGTVTLIGTQKPGEYEQIINMINKNGLNTIHVKSNPNKFYIVYRPGSEDAAWELYRIAEKYGGYFAHNATKQDSIRIGQLLGYNQSAIDAYVKQNHEWNPPETVDSVFESVKRLRKLMNLTEDTVPMEQQLRSLSPQFAQAAQSVYNEWEQDQDGIDDVYGGGGICDDIAEQMCNVVSNSTHYGAFHFYNEYECHTSIYVYDSDNQLCYNVDISPYNYETGGGYTWKKIPDVKFQPGMVDVHQVDYDQFIDEDGNPRENY